ncbi:LysM peptidoglycan-binding domain-containing protein, partial [Pseudomonas sp. CrR14]|nr:LysM peptidoglycan-binding domain-containing protein [Pseudomonas sp. CrR14]
HLIAKRFNVQMKSLQSWNPRTGKALKPGQVLTLRLPD